MTLRMLGLLILLSIPAPAAQMESFRDSQSLRVDPLVLFHDTYRAYFKHEEKKVKGMKGMTGPRFDRYIPSKDVQEKTYLAVVKNAHRFWKGRHAEMMLYGIGALILSESGGVNIGNPKDPSFGMLHVKVEATKAIADALGFYCPENNRAISRKLSRDIEYNILVGVSELAISMSSFDETPRNFTRAIMGYKMGFAGATRWFNAHKNNQMSKLPFILYYEKCLSRLLSIREAQAKLLKEAPNGVRNRP